MSRVTIDRKPGDSKVGEAGLSEKGRAKSLKGHGCLRGGDLEEKGKGSARNLSGPKPEARERGGVGRVSQVRNVRMEEKASQDQAKKPAVKSFC